MRITFIVVRVLLLVELIVLVHIYIFGKNGLCLLETQKKHLYDLEHTIDDLQKEVDSLEHDIHEWKVNDFHKEKIAREQLQMARKDDKLFYIGS